MDGNAPPPTRETPHWHVLERFVLGAALLGLCVGIYEAALLYFTPWLPTLPSSDVGYVVWFLDPLVNMAFFSALGAMLGSVAAVTMKASVKAYAIAAAALIGVTVAHVAWSLNLVHVWVGDIKAIGNLRTPGVAFISGFAVALYASRKLQRRIGWFFDPARVWPARALRKALLAVAVVLVAGLATHLARHSDLLSPPLARSAPQRDHPNIVLITLDTVRADHLSVYGYRRLATPHLDRFAARGVVFENAIAPTSWTLPSIASLFTGLLPHQHGADAYTPLAETPRTLAELLRSYGYETAGFVANGYGLGGWGLHQGFDVYDDNSLLLRHNLAPTLVGRALWNPFYHHLVRPDFYFRRNAQEVNDHVLRWFHRRSGRPFFLFINYFDPHDPYYAPAPFAKKFGQVPEGVVRRVSWGEGFPLRPPLSAEENESLIAGYDNSLAYLDEQVGRLLGALTESDDGSNTIVIITSDHGEAFGEHSTYLHGRNLYYQEALRVPLIIVGPGIPAGIRFRHIARIRELFPSILDLALGHQLPLHALSLRRYWTPGYQPGPQDDYVVSEVVPFLPDFRPTMISLMTNEWHFIHRSDGQSELFHWPTDPDEQANLAEFPDHQQGVQELRHRLEGIIGHSLQPWRGAGYLSALDRPGFSFQHELAFNPAYLPKPPTLRIGMSQALFPADAVTSSRRAVPIDEDLLKSLPYR